MSPGLQRFARRLRAMLTIGKPPKLYRARLCQGFEWSRAFPQTSTEDIRSFWHLFVFCFAFADRFATCFAPSDRILDIYRSLYPSPWLADALECETLAALFEREYEVSFDSVWHEELTLGALFGAVASRP